MWLGAWSANSGYSTFTRESLLIKLQMQVINTSFNLEAKMSGEQQSLHSKSQLYIMSVNGSACLNPLSTQSGFTQHITPTVISNIIAKVVPGIHWARRCWRPVRPGATVCRETRRCSTLDCRADPHWLAHMPLRLRGCVRHGCIGSSWTGHSECHFHSATAAAAEHDDPRRAGWSSPTCRTLKRAGKMHQLFKLLKSPQNT